ncbi:NYN domain-containing protein [Candidatus Peregrinibacteria bacterium]|nr:NYN domain-containing protein [Candidatus Peregrinibacteria bacterium]
MKIYAFIDSQNLNLAIRRAGWQLDFKKFRVYLKDKYKAEKAYLFMGYSPGNEKLYITLQQTGYIIVFKPTLQNRNGEIIKGNCDAELVLHCMIEYNNFDKSIIISGDGDFYCLIKYLLENNKLLKVGIPNKYKCSALLRKFAEYFFYMNNLRDKLEYKKERH